MENKKGPQRNIVPQMGCFFLNFVPPDQISLRGPASDLRENPDSLLQTGALAPAQLLYQRSLGCGIPFILACLEETGKTVQF